MTEVTSGSGNIFADLGLPDAAEHLVKARIAAEITRIIRERDLTQAGAATLLGVDQPKISNIVRGKLSGFTLERLLRFVTDLDCDVQILLKPALPGKKGQIAVAA